MNFSRPKIKDSKEFIDLLSLKITRVRAANSSILILIAGLMLFACASQKIMVPPVSETPTNEQHLGKIVWHDLLTNDVKAVKEFYGSLFGWEFHSLTGKDSIYTTIIFNGKPIGGIVFVDDLEDNLNSSQWLSYLSVEDVDIATDMIIKAGGKIYREPWNLEGRGRTSVVADPQGALIALLKADSGDPQDQEPETFNWLWSELLTKDASKAVTFYEQLSGYTSGKPEIETQIEYYVLKTDGVARAGVGQLPWDGVQPNWLPYILVTDPAPIVENVKNLGGTVFLPPDKKIRKGSVAIIADPSGAVLAIQKWPF